MMHEQIRTLLREGIDGMTNEALIGKFVDFVVDYLGIKTNLSLVLTTDKSDIETFSPSFITSIRTDNSFIEFKDDKKYTYKEGMSYIIKSGVEHRIFNLNDEHRITLCVTPEVNDHVLKLVA